jgi:nickel transport protein
VEFQNGRSDAKGRFSFAPEKNGAWKIMISDGMGHKAVKEVHIKDPENPLHNDQPKAQPGINSTSVLLGLSLLANIFLLLMVVKQKTKRIKNN